MNIHEKGKKCTMGSENLRLVVGMKIDIKGARINKDIQGSLHYLLPIQQRQAE